MEGCWVHSLAYTIIHFFLIKFKNPGNTHSFVFLSISKTKATILIRFIRKLSKQMPIIKTEVFMCTLFEQFARFVGYKI